MSHRPRIGVSLPQRGYRMMRWCTVLAVRLAGGVPIAVTTRSPTPNGVLDGLVLGGGTDIHPSLYGQPPKPYYGYDPQRDALEQRWLEQMLHEQKPVLAICRGAQLLNVVLGGTLHLDVQKAYEKARYPSGLLARIFYRKPMAIIEGSRLHAVARTRHMRVNSMHTQAIDALGKGLRVTAREPSGVVQCVELTTEQPVIGVQFHPEFMAYRPSQWRLFRLITREAKASKLL